MSVLTSSQFCLPILVNSSFITLPDVFCFSAFCWYCFMLFDYCFVKVPHIYIHAYFQLFYVLILELNTLHVTVCHHVTYKRGFIQLAKVMSLFRQGNLCILRDELARWFYAPNFMCFQFTKYLQMFFRGFHTHWFSLITHPICPFFISQKQMLVQTNK